MQLILKAFSGDLYHLIPLRYVIGIRNSLRIKNNTFIFRIIGGC